MTPCLQEENIKEMYGNISMLEERTKAHDNVLDRIENKLDKLVWFFLGLVTSACGAVIVMLVNKG